MARQRFFTVVKTMDHKIGVHSFDGNNPKHERRIAEKAGFFVVGVYANMIDARAIIEREHMIERAKRN